MIYKAFVSDLGNVLLDFDMGIATKKATRFTSLTEEEIFNTLFDSELPRLHERGHLSGPEFYERVKERLRLSLDFDGFKAIWNDIFSKNEAMCSLIKRLKDGWAFTVFPEGTRTKTGKFGSPKKGVGMIAVMADVPVVPCWIEGSYKAKPFVSKITLHFLPPFKPSEIKAETKKDHYLLVSERIMYDIIKFYNTHHGLA